MILVIILINYYQGNIITNLCTAVNQIPYIDAYSDAKIDISYYTNSNEMNENININQSILRILNQDLNSPVTFGDSSIFSTSNGKKIFNTIVLSST